MSNEYRNNHYVPQWYQKRFLPIGQEAQELFYLDFKPGEFVDPRGIAHPRKPLKLQGFKHCFVQKDLYTTKVKGLESVDIERYFFGEIDNKGRDAVDCFTDFAPSVMGKDTFRDLMIYISTQKLRTPKALEWLKDRIGTSDRQQTLSSMIDLRQLYCAIWTECVWQIADATLSETKFIISDHPVTVYNRRCGPRSQWCRGFNDPDIWMHATHTIFPLSMDKVLILTNLSWVRNPYQKETDFRPNPAPLRSAILKLEDIQTLRRLSEHEVKEFNFIIKSRALRFIAAAKEEWLYPERSVSKSDWHAYGNGYLFMPDPRPMHLGGTIMWGGGPGPGGAMDEYGRRPWDKDFEKEARAQLEHHTLDRFKGEFARLFGPERRGRSFQFGHLDNERDEERLHKYHLGLEKRRHGNKNG